MIRRVKNDEGTTTHHSIVDKLCRNPLFATTPEGPWNKTHVTCSSHTWFIYNLNTILLLAAFTQYYDTYTHIDNAKSWCNPLWIPLANSPCWFPWQLPFPWVPPTYLESLLSAWCDPRPPWSQVACKLTSLSPFPPHSNFPTPHGLPKSIVRPSKTTSRHRLHIVRNTPDGWEITF